MFALSVYKDRLVIFHPIHKFKALLPAANCRQRGGYWFLTLCKQSLSHCIVNKHDKNVTPKAVNC